MRSYVVKRLPHLRHSRLRRMESASLLSRESTTLSFAKPQKGHFIEIERELMIVTGNAWQKIRGAPFAMAFKSPAEDLRIAVLPRLRLLGSAPTTCAAIGVLDVPKSVPREPRIQT